MGDDAQPLGAVLAGGAASRLGGSKASVELAGHALIEYPLAALAAAGLDVVVVAKAGTELPPLGPPVVTEPDEPLHPLFGVVTAIAHGQGRPVVTCPCDTPFVTPGLIARLAAVAGAAVAHDGARLHPLIARFESTDLPELRSALAAGSSATAAVEALSPALIEVDEGETFNVNTPADLRHAAAIVTRAL